MIVHLHRVQTTHEHMSRTRETGERDGAGALHRLLLRGPRPVAEAVRGHGGCTPGRPGGAAHRGRAAARSWRRGRSP